MSDGLIRQTRNRMRRSR